MTKVLVTPRSFGKYNREEIIELFAEKGIEIEFNPFGQIMTEEQMMECLEDKDGLIVGVDPVNEKVLSKAKKLKAIAKYGVGLDNIDLACANKKQIKVSKTVSANSNAVADYSFALLMSVARRVVEINNEAKDGNWEKTVALDVYGKKIGVVGLGAICRGVVRRAQGFEMEVYGYDIYRDDDYLRENQIHFADIDTIIKECDFISIHMPLTEETKHLFNRENLRYAKENLIIINTARGGIVDEDALYDLLKAGKIYGAGVDVFEEEPAQDSKLLDLENVVIGSHTAASTIGATEMMSMMASRNIIADLGGQVKNG